MQDQWQEPKQPSVSYGGDEKAWKLVEALAQSSLKEQRRSRRWGIFFKLLTFCWLFALVGALYTSLQVSEISIACFIGSAHSSG